MWLRLLATNNQRNSDRHSGLLKDFLQSSFGSTQPFKISEILVMLSVLQSSEGLFSLIDFPNIGNLFFLLYFKIWFNPLIVLQRF